jgi:hypothetical protein
MLHRLRSLFRKPARAFRVGDLVRYRGRAMAVADITAKSAKLIWFEDEVMHACVLAGFAI